MLSVISERLRLPVVISFPSMRNSSNGFIDLDVGPLSYSPFTALSKCTAPRTSVGPQMVPPPGKFSWPTTKGSWKGAVLMLKCRSCFTAQSCWPRLFKRGKWRVQLIEVTVKGSDSQEIPTKFTLKPGHLFLLGSQSNFWNGSSGASRWESQSNSMGGQGKLSFPLTVVILSHPALCRVVWSGSRNGFSPEARQLISEGGRKGEPQLQSCYWSRENHS